MLLKEFILQCIHKLLNLYFPIDFCWTKAIPYLHLCILHNFLDIYKKKSCSLPIHFYDGVQVGQFLFGQLGIGYGVNAVITNGRVSFFFKRYYCLANFEHIFWVRYTSWILNSVYLKFVCVNSYEENFLSGRTHNLQEGERLNHGIY